MQIDLGTDFFELFGLARAFDLDPAALSARYRELQRAVHPDRFSHGSEQERRLSMQLTTRVNEAFQTLKDPVRRARYLLGLNGVDTDEETDTRMDPAFLAEQMELREELEEVARAPGRAPMLAKLGAGIEARVEQKLAELGRQFTRADTASLARARALVRELQFLDKLLHEVQTLEEEEHV